MNQARTAELLLNQIEEQASDHPPLQEVASLLREVCGVLRDLQEQVAGRVKDFYTVDEVAEMTGRAAYTVRGWIRDGKIDAQRIEGTGPKGRLLVPRAELEKLVRAGMGKGVAGISST